MLNLGEEFALALQKSRRMGYKTLSRGAVYPLANALETKAGLYLINKEGRQMLGIGDEGVREVLKIPKNTPTGEISKAPDFLTITKGNELALSEVKQLDAPGGAVDVSRALSQLANAMKRLQELNLFADLGRVEIIIPKGAALRDNFGVVNGYLVKIIENNKRWTVPGFKNMVMVIEL